MPVRTYSIRSNPLWLIEHDAARDRWLLKLRPEKVKRWTLVAVYESAEAAAEAVGTRHTGVPSWDYRPHDTQDFALEHWKQTGGPAAEAGNEAVASRDN